MSAKYLSIHPKNPEERKIEEVAKTLQKGGVIIYPSDTVYAFGCDINNAKAIEQICRIRGIKPEKQNFSIVCRDLSHLSDFTKPIPNEIFKLMKRNVPGPFTFILNANTKVPKLLGQNKKTVGIRVPNNAILQSIIAQFDSPIVSASLKYINDDDNEFLEYPTDPELIYDMYKNMVDLVIDGGPCGQLASTIVDCTEEPFSIIREGLGELI
jgi:tRNA threonylcarbamoyl adenosine modification protein (Sua5/YciO/YrdC/YwlC family)